MNIAIIGAGFYGCYIASKLAESHSISIYEKNSKPCLGAITNNQHRLHLGYHYPRCEKTVEQTIKTYNQFISEFKPHVTFIDNNVYAVHEKSNLNFKDYKRVFDSFSSLNHSVIHKNDRIWDLVKNKSEFSGALRTREGVLNCRTIRQQLIGNIHKSKNIKLFCNATICENKLFQISKNHDIVINCTYNKPFLAVQKTIATKDQACLIAVMKNPKYSNVGLTIMDGPFCSLYPIKNEIFSCSSVLYTPIDSDVSQYDVKQKLNNIINHNKQYFYINNNDLIDYYYGVKTKIQNDFKDERYSFVSRENNIITVFAGKISSVVESYIEVLNEIQK